MSPAYVSQEINRLPVILTWRSQWMCSSVCSSCKMVAEVDITAACCAAILLGNRPPLPPPLLLLCFAGAGAALTLSCACSQSILCLLCSVMPCVDSYICHTEPYRFPSQYVCAPPARWLLLYTLLLLYHNSLLGHRPRLPPPLLCCCYCCVLLLLLLVVLSLLRVPRVSCVCCCAQLCRA